MAITILVDTQEEKEKVIEFFRKLPIKLSSGVLYSNGGYEELETIYKRPNDILVSEEFVEHCQKYHSTTFTGSFNYCIS